MKLCFLSMKVCNCCDKCDVHMEVITSTVLFVFMFSLLFFFRGTYKNVIFIPNYHVGRTDDGHELQFQVSQLYCWSNCSNL